MKTNYHTHNYRCNHGKGTVLEYVSESINNNFDEIGISDHIPHPGIYIDTNSRMDYSDLENYFNDIDEAIKLYGDKISIKKSMECEYFREYTWLYNELKEKYKVDYLILGAHFFLYKNEMTYVGIGNFTPHMLDAYIDYLIESMESGYFKYLAHPDVFGISYLNWDEHSERASRRLFKKAEELKITLEININGLRKPKIECTTGLRYQYPIKEFWLLSKEYNVDIIIGIDAHSPKEMNDLNIGINFAKALDIKLIDRLNF